MAQFPETPARRVPIPHVDALYSKEAERFVAERQPFVTRIKDWGALNWSLPYFTEKIGHLQMPLVRTADGERVESTLAHVLELSKDPTWRQRYMPLQGGGPLITPQFAGRPLDPTLECLRADYKLPAYLPADQVSAELLFRASDVDTSTYFQTPSHFEWDAMEFFSMQIRGRKHLWLFGPDQAPYLGIKSELPDFPFLSVGAHACGDPAGHPEIGNATCYEVVLEPGDLIYWPAFWFHWFTHYHDYQISFRMRFPQKQQPLNPISASWVFSNALAKVLGGFAEAPERYEALPEETKTLLRSIEEAFFNDEGLVDTTTMYARRLSPEVRKKHAEANRRSLAAAADPTKTEKR